MASSRRRFLEGTAASIAAGLLGGCGGKAGSAGAGSLPADAAAPRPDAASPPPPRPDAAPADAAPDAGPVEPPEDVAESDAFPLGVASGDPSDGRAVVWARYAGDRPLLLVAWEMRGDAYARQIASLDVRPADGGFVHAELEGLAAGARHRYAFFELDGSRRLARSPVGAFRAALAPSALEPLVLGAVSCTTINRAPFRTLERAAMRDLDLFLLCGDTAYCDGAITLPEYRDKWAEHLATAGYRALRARTAVAATWDDHEVENNFDPETLDPGQLAAARQAFFENLPVRRDPVEPTRIWRRLRWGRTLDLFVLDSRSERRPSTRDTPEAEYLSRAQLDWLMRGLQQSTAAFKLIVNSVPIANYPGVFDVQARDRWEGYPAQRRALLAFIDDLRIPGVLWVSGDFHLAAMGRVATEGPGAGAIEILAGPGAQLGNVLAPTLQPPQFDWASAESNYTTLALDPATRAVTVRYHDAADALLAERTYMLG